ncbi:MAG TPA: hypothetical protein VIM44_06945, partial [Rariglobus sp.]
MSATASLTLVFDSNNRLAVQEAGHTIEPAPAATFARLTAPREFFTLKHAGRDHRVFFAQTTDSAAAGVTFRPLEQLAAAPSS